MPPRIAAIRGRAYHATKENARIVHDPVFALLGELDEEGFNQANKFLNAEFDSGDRPDFIPQGAYNALAPLVLPNDATGAAVEAEGETGPRVRHVGKLRIPEKMQSPSALRCAICR
eukprot:7334895-Pyramimonas_sp.AAC.1